MSVCVCACVHVCVCVCVCVCMCGAETWPIKARQMNRLNLFHRSCVRSILGVSRSDQHYRHLTTADLAQRGRLPEDIGTLLREYRQRWLGHVARMDTARIPQQVLFGELKGELRSKITPIFYCGTH